MTVLPPRRDRGNARDLLLVKSGGEATVPEWQAAFRALAPELEVRSWNDPTVDPAAVIYVLVSQPDPGRLALYPNLRVIFSAAAGVEHITCDPTLPAHVPIVRMVNEEISQTMGEFVCLACLSILRDYPRIAAAQAECRWDNFEPPHTARDKCVGILGFGTIGSVAARMLLGLGFRVAGWARHGKNAGEIEVFAGAEELPAFLAGADILVNLLPETPETQGLIDARRLALLPRGAGLVNAGRGSTVVLPDLVAALDDGHLTGAVLDVFDEEPLPPDSHLWWHTRITVTPHLAGFASRRARAETVVATLQAIARGEAPPNLCDRARGY